MAALPQNSLKENGHHTKGRPHANRRESGVTNQAMTRELLEKLIVEEQKVNVEEHSNKANG